MNRYDPLKAPEAEKWLALDEQERADLVEQYHKKARVALPNRIVHASMHTIVENQLAEGTPEVQEALSRLMAEGLDRHEAIHAIASVVAGQMWHALRGEAPAGNLGEQYLHALQTFTAAEWRKKAR